MSDPADAGGAEVIDELPIFPLNTVLFPQGVLPLRIFEPRYLDMVRDCLRDETPFGVCLITDGQEVGRPAEHETAGCTARIAAWDMEQLGLLNIRVVGEQRFTIDSTRIRPDGLIVAQVTAVPEEIDYPVPEDYAASVALLEQIVRDHVDNESDPMRKMIEPPYAYSSASWVSNRLCEFLPVSAGRKQKMMMLDDPIARLTVVHGFLRKQGVI